MEKEADEKRLVERESAVGKGRQGGMYPRVGRRKREKVNAERHSSGKAVEAENRGVRSETPVAEGQRKRPIVFSLFLFFSSPAAVKG